MKKCYYHGVRQLVLIIVCFAKAITCFSQKTMEYKWWDPATNSFPVIEGQAWPGEVKDHYDRFPARAEKTLNPNVWNLSHSSAGLYLKFKTDASDIVVRYIVA